MICLKNLGLLRYYLQYLKMNSNQKLEDLLYFLLKFIFLSLSFYLPVSKQPLSVQYWDCLDALKRLSKSLEALLIISEQIISILMEKAPSELSLIKLELNFTKLLSTNRWLTLEINTIVGNSNYTREFRRKFSIVITHV